MLENILRQDLERDARGAAPVMGLLLLGDQREGPSPPPGLVLNVVIVALTCPWLDDGNMRAY